MDQFRGVRADNGEFIYGIATRFEKGSLIVPGIVVEHESDSGDWVEYVEVKGDSITRSTGICNDDGTKLFSGDAVVSTVAGWSGTIEWRQGKDRLVISCDDGENRKLSTYSKFWGLEVVNG